MARGLKTSSRTPTTVSVHLSMPSVSICTDRQSSYLSTMRPGNRSLSLYTALKAFVPFMNLLRYSKAAVILFLKNSVSISSFSLVRTLMAMSEWGFM